MEATTRHVRPPSKDGGDYKTELKTWTRFPVSIKGEPVRFVEVLGRLPSELSNYAVKIDSHVKLLCTSNTDL